VKILAVAVSAAAALLASTASAATYADAWTTSATGGISVVFGDNGLDIPGAEIVPGETVTTHAYDAGTGAFTDTFSFFLPNGIVGFTLSSIGFAPNSSLTVTGFTFNGASLGVTNAANASGGITVLGSGGPFTVATGGPQTLVITGTGGPDAVFSGTATFEAAAVGGIPEPATWALMLGGFGGAGAILRRRRGQLAMA
jgi:hypothetical protein